MKIVFVNFFVDLTVKSFSFVSLFILNPNIFNEKAFVVQMVLTLQISKVLIINRKYILTFLFGILHNLDSVNIYAETSVVSKVQRSFFVIKLF